MTGCSALGCCNRSERGFRLHSFPRDPSRRVVWEANVNCLNSSEKPWTASKCSKLCQVHFGDSQFESHRADGLKKLKVNAVPTIFFARRKFPPTARKSSRKRSPVSKITRPNLIPEDHTYTRVQPPSSTAVDSEISADEQSNKGTLQADTESAKLRELEERVDRYKTELHKVRKKNKRLLKLLFEKPRVVFPGCLEATS